MAVAVFRSINPIVGVITPVPTTTITTTTTKTLASTMASSSSSSSGIFLLNGGQRIRVPNPRDVFIVGISCSGSIVRNGNKHDYSFTRNKNDKLVIVLEVVQLVDRSRGNQSHSQDVPSLSGLVRNKEKRNLRYIYYQKKETKRKRKTNNIKSSSESSLV